MTSLVLLCLAFLYLRLSNGLRYQPDQVGFNLNENEEATEPRLYSGKWENHTFNPSPDNWRSPTFVLTIDRFIDGNPTNNDANKTVFENDWMANQFRFGGDTAGILDNLDYLEGMGIKTIYLTGSMMLNMPWSPDGYGPLDFTLLDRHHGAIQEWRDLITEIHRRGMYVIFDNTVSTMGDLLGYGNGFTNKSASFRFEEYDFLWKNDYRYHDFAPGNEHNASCQYPRIFEQNGYLLPQNISDQFHGCRASEFDMYGDIKGTGAYESYINQLSRFASVQDRLREWMPSVLEKINVMSCLQITMLDIDGFRIDKAVQVTIDALSEFSDYQRSCARSVGKENFLIVGELVADPLLAAVYFGRGKQPNQRFATVLDSVSSSGKTDASTYVRPLEKAALDGAAFHYDVYGSLTRFLGLDGPWGSLGVDWVAIWNHLLVTVDMVNTNTGKFDPRHMFGTTNQDVFRWPALASGTARQLLGLFVTTLELPGVPMMFYGEEQEYFTVENLAPDYVYGRTPYGSSRAWQLHGCYDLGEEVYVDMPFNRSKYGCYDDSVSRDHRDSSHPLRNLFKRMFELRDHYPVLNDGFNLTTLSTFTKNIYLHGSNGMPSPTGLWSVYRGRSETVQDFTGSGWGNQGVWLLFHNDDHNVTYQSDCTSLKSINGSLLAPYDANTTVRNLFYPYEEYQLSSSSFMLGIEGSTKSSGCLPQVQLRAWEFKALVPVDKWQNAKPVITRTLPYHDERILSTVSYTETETIPIEIRFSQAMDCDSITKNLVVNSTAQGGRIATLDQASVKCEDHFDDLPSQVGYVPSQWRYTATLENVANGIHTYTITNATSKDGTLFTQATDRFMFRVGQSDNPMVFPLTSNYTSGIFARDSSGKLTVSPRAAGAEMIKYSTNWGSSWSNWTTYTDQALSVQEQNWTGTKVQEWTGNHVVLQFWSKAAGSSHHVQHSDLETTVPRRWPHAWVQGVFNQWGYDLGLENMMNHPNDSTWTFDLYNEFPTNIIVNVWGMNPDGQPDKSAAFGDIDRDFVLDWLSPNTIANNVINISTSSSAPGYRLIVNDGNYSFRFVPVGSSGRQLAVMLLICIMPLSTALLGCWLFMRTFYHVKFNEFGSGNAKSTPFGFISNLTGLLHKPDRAKSPPPIEIKTEDLSTEFVAGSTVVKQRKSVLFATIEYEVEDWKIKVKIGGLGAMASLMAKTVQARDMYWVIPCIGGVDYPFSDDTICEPFIVTILDAEHMVQVHCYENKGVTYVFLDAPVFRGRSKDQPYPARMDDLESAVYYSTWNQCIAAALQRFNPSIYHINDYHGAVAPLYLLPNVIPCCLSLHNAEFQGLWSLKSKKEIQDMCSIFNLPQTVITDYVQFGDVFNLLHTGVSYLRKHQNGFGAVGVSDKYSKRTLKRYPIFWSIPSIGSLPNPDPSDLADYDKSVRPASVRIDHVAEGQRATFRRQAQEWAGLKIDPNAELFIFIGRWSKQKGIDVIADVFPSILQKYPSTQLMCIGPVIDLYGKFAALKFQNLMEAFPGRVYSKPEFTAIPPFIHKGAEFALMPSRDEPFGLVAVEFGRKGALCIGARVGGFGNMPGWWFPVESMTTDHMIKQFHHAIVAAIGSPEGMRKQMRAFCMVQRFPVAQWLRDLETLYSVSEEKCEKVSRQRANRPYLQDLGSFVSLKGRAGASNASTPMIRSPNVSQPSTRAATPVNALSAMDEPNEYPFSAQHNRSLVSPDLIRSPTPGRLSPSQGIKPNVTSDDFELDLQGDTTRPSTPSAAGYGRNFSSRTNSPDPYRLSVGTIRGRFGTDILSKTAPTFEDPEMEYYDRYNEILQRKVKEGMGKGTFGPPIEEYLAKSEQEWFAEYHSASLGISRAHSKVSLLPRSAQTSAQSSRAATPTGLGINEAPRSNRNEKFREYLGDDYQAPVGIQKILMVNLGTWPVYSLFLAFGQIICANPYQLTLITGQIGAPSTKLYTLCSIYALTTIMWWVLHQRVRSYHLLSWPFFFFGLAFFIIAVAGGINGDKVALKGTLYNIAAGVYTAGSSAGALYFALNFGTEAGMPTEVWAIRACVIAGIQQFVIAFLWYWGSYLTQNSLSSNIVQGLGKSAALLGFGIPMALLMWSMMAIIYYGLPNGYHQKPGSVPSFYRSFISRPLILWFLLTVVLQGYWLTTNYTRNWIFLWSSDVAPRWGVSLLVILFFGPVWVGMMYLFTRLTKDHVWVIPIFAICLGCPRWCQMIWSLSGVGAHIPWAASPASGALISRAVWLWLGVLDLLQGVGLGTTLLMSLTRLHTLAALISAQFIGAIITILARGTAPHRLGPNPVFPNLAAENLHLSVWFWIALLCQLVVCVGFLKLYRKSQLTKP